MQWTYPTNGDLRGFVAILQEKKYRVSKYLPHITDEWFEVIHDCIQYVENTSHYQDDGSFHDVCARILYKVAKRHELHDGNKRSALIVVYIFCVLNDYIVKTPANLKNQARRAARTKGRKNEEIVRKRIAEDFSMDILSYAQIEELERLADKNTNSAE